MSEPQFVAETLKWCNAKRKEQGKKPLKKLPKGEREDGASCPCGKATGLWVDLRDFAASRDEWREGEVTALPGAVMQFVRAFDSGQLPQYEAKA